MAAQVDCYLDDTAYLDVCNEFALQLAPLIPSMTAIEFKDNPDRALMDIKIWLELDGQNFSTLGTFRIADMIYGITEVVQSTAQRVSNLVNLQSRRN